MRISKPIILSMPTILVNELEDNLIKRPPKFNFKINYFYFIIQEISIQQTIQKDTEFFYLYIKNLKSITVSNIERYIRYMKEINLIISDGKYIIGKKALMYKLNDEFLKGEYSKIEINCNENLFKKIIKQIRRDNAHNSRFEPHLKRMRDELMKVEFNYVEANKWIENKAENETKKLSYLMTMQNIEDKRMRYFNRNDTNNRLDTNLTNLKSELKQFIKGDYVSIDLCNSQPFILGVLLNRLINNNILSYCCYLNLENIYKTFGSKRIQKILKVNQNQENCNLVNLSLYLESVKNGNLYDDFISYYSGNLKRKEIKDIMFKVMFSGNINGKFKTIPYKEEKKVFASVFPYVYECIFNLKHDDKDNNLLPVYLQQLESYLFIDCIAKELVNEGIIPLTVHDSVIVRAEDEKRALEIIQKVFLTEVGLIPTFNIEPIKKRIEKSIKQLYLTPLNTVKYGHYEQRTISKRKQRQTQRGN